MRVWVDPVDEVHSERIGLKNREEDRVVDDESVRLRESREAHRSG